MNLSLVLATSKRTDILTRTLESFTRLHTDGLEWEVFVVDNADHEPTKAVVSTFQTRLPLTYLVERTKGKNYALNAALTHVSGELIVFTDDDILAEPDWLEELWNGAQAWPDHSVFGGRILPHFPTESVTFDLKNRLVRSAYVIADWNRPDGPYQPSMVWGPNFAVRASLIRDGYRFNTDFGPNGGQYLMGDETEFVYRLQQAGYPPVYLGRALVHHQIRPEQLTMAWLRERVASYGGTYAFMTGMPDAPVVFGVPRYMYVVLMQAMAQYMAACVRMNPKVRFESELMYWYRKGMFAQYWRGVPKHKFIDY